MMITKHLAVLALGLTMCSGAALAQNNPPSNTPNAASSSKMLTQFQPGQWRATKLKGLNVYNNNNEKIGDINELVVDQSGKIDAVVIGVGGFLGMGEHDVAVPFNEIKFVNEPARSASNTNAPAKRNATTTGAGTDRTTTTTNNNNRAYPDHAVLNMTKDQLKAAPEFKYQK